eukprot:gene30908-38199_t
MIECGGCRKLYCTYHSQQAGLGCLKGAVSSAAQLTKGHVCNISKGGAVANFAGSASYIAVGSALTATAFVVSGGSALVIGAAVLSGAVAGGGDFKGVVLNAISFGAGRAVGGFVGIKLAGSKDLSERAIKILGTCAGGIAGGLLWTDAALGALSGAQGGFLGVKAGLLAKQPPVSETSTPSMSVSPTCPQIEAAKQAGRPVMDSLQQAQAHVGRGDTAVSKKVVVSVLTTADGQTFTASSGPPNAPFLLQANGSAPVTGDSSLLEMSHTSRMFGIDIKPLAVIEERVAPALSNELVLILQDNGSFRL